MFRASVSKMCPQGSEKPKQGYFLGLETLKKFPYELMAIALPLYTILDYEKFHRMFCFGEQRELYVLFLSAPFFYFCKFQDRLLLPEFGNEH